MTLQIAENIRKMRAARGLTQGELAKELCVSPQSVSRWENGQAYPDMEQLPRLADFFGVSLDKLMRGTESRLPRLLEQLRTAEGEMRADPSPVRQRQVCSLLEKITAEEGSGTHYLGRYFYELLRLQKNTSAPLETQVEKVRERYRQELREAGIDDSLALLSSVLLYEAEDKLFQWRKYLPNDPQAVEWDDFMVQRYRFHGAPDKWESAWKRVLRRNVRNLVEMLLSDRPEIPHEMQGAHVHCPLRASEYYKAALDILDAVSSHGDDIFLDLRLRAEWSYAGAICFEGRKEEGLSVIDKVLEQLMWLWDQRGKERELFGDSVLRDRIPCKLSDELIYGCISDILGQTNRREFDSVREQARFLAILSFADRIGIKTVPDEQRRSWHILNFKEHYEPMLHLAKGIPLKDGNAQVTVFVTEKGNMYHSVEQDATVGQANTLRLLEKMQKEGDCHIVRIVCVWQGGYVDVPSYAVRLRVRELDSRNQNADVLLNGGLRYSVKPLSALLSPS